MRFQGSPVHPGQSLATLVPRLQLLELREADRGSELIHTVVVAEHRHVIVGARLVSRCKVPLVMP